MTDRACVSLETRSLLLRPLVPSDIEPMLAMSQEDCARKWLPSQVYRDTAHAASAVDWLIRQFDLRMTPRTNAFVFGVVDKATARLIGHVGLSPLLDGVEVGFGIATSEQGKGYAAEAVSGACAWGIERFSLPGILGVTDRENVPSQRVLRRCGFRTREEKVMRFQGVERSVIIFELPAKNPLTDDVRLREVVEDDLPLFFDFQLDPGANHMAAFTARDPTDREAFTRHWNKVMADPTTINRTVVCNGQVVGSVSSYEEAGKPEVTYWIGRAYWGKGIATRALAAFLAQDNAARPIYARVAKDNLGSRRILEKRGFQVITETKGFANARGEEIEELLLELAHP